MQQQQQQQQRVAAAVETYDVFDTGAERTVPPGGGKGYPKDTQYGNPMVQQQRQQARQGAEEAETAEEERGRVENHMIREVRPLNIDAVACSTSVYL